MASQKTGNLQIIGSTGSSSDGAAATTTQQGDHNISDDEDDGAKETYSSETEITFTGAEAVKICYFCKDDLKNLGAFYKASVVKEPPEGSMITKVTIKGGEKYAEDIENKVTEMKKHLKSLSEETIKLDVTKASDVKQIAQDYVDDTQLLVYISPMERLIYVFAEDYGKLTKAVHRLKVCLGMIAPSSRAGRSLESKGTGSETPGTKNKPYPDLSKMGASMDTDDHEKSRDYPRTNAGREYRKDDRGEYKKPRHGGNRKVYQRDRDDDSRLRNNSDDEDFSEEFRFDSGFVLKVYKASITKLQVDAIVNAANDNLMHGGGVAKVISRAAGYKLDKESNEYVQKKGLLKVSENCLTTAGDLYYKKVIHAVGPQWYDYANKKDCLDDLYRTVFNVLTRSEKERYKKVAMSAISAGIYAVPKTLCADMYVLAAVDFSALKKRYPQELHIIDVDINILKLVKISYDKWKQDPSSIQAAETLRQYFKDHPDCQYSKDDQWTNQGRGQGRGRRFNRQFSEPDNRNAGSGVSKVFDGLDVKKEKTVPLSWGEDASVFNVNDSVKVYIYTGRIEKLEDVDAVICGTDTWFGSSGYIASAFLQEFGDKYRTNFNRMKLKEKNQARLGYVYTCESGSRKVPNVMHLAIKSLVYETRDELQDYRRGLLNIFSRAERRKFGKIALPLLGTGFIQNKTEILKHCCRCVLEALADFVHEGNRKNLFAVHLVNNKDEISQMMKNVFEEVEQSGKKSNTDGLTTRNHEYAADTGSYHRSNSDFDEEENRSKMFLDSSTTRRYGSHRSADNREPDGFENLARSRRNDDQDVVSGLETAASEHQAQSESANSDKKKKGNLRIIIQE